MASYCGRFQRGERVREFDDADFLARYMLFIDWLAMQNPVSDAAILSRCRAVFASSAGANESLAWYAEGLRAHSVANCSSPYAFTRLVQLCNDHIDDPD